MGGRMSRTKGKVGEREWAQYLKDRGFKNARRGQQFKGGQESPDVVGVTGVHFEVKRSETFSPYAALNQADTERKPSETPVVAHRKNGKDWIVVMKAEDFVLLLRRTHEVRTGGSGEQDVAAPDSRYAVALRELKAALLEGEPDVQPPR